ncbi:hypothetical protein POV27_07345 [Aureisphaera galaxeae]|uniref:hypothetical protein n=1 Tax=Aureisphaera galaxeae TaxID=1538023 RepID=UPI0023501848|nr:hypothetical protein [Aureisphaera galaxeae]MDC8003861.1 hypothetical protein [Aureisphaera galaxeae]
MNTREIETLEHFLTKTSMWIHPVNETSIVSFIHGFEAGIGSKTFTSGLKEYLESRYDLYGSNQGWPRQILLYAEKKNMEWKDAFIEIGKIVLQDIIEELC